MRQNGRIEFEPALTLCMVRILNSRFIHLVLESLCSNCDELTIPLIPSIDAVTNVPSTRPFKRWLDVLFLWVCHTSCNIEAITSHWLNVNIARNTNTRGDTRLIATCDCLRASSTYFKG